MKLAFYRTGTSLKALLAVVFWGFSFVATRIALEWLTPTALVATRLAIGAGAMTLITWAAKSDSKLNPGDRLRCVGLGLILAFHLLIQNFGLLETTATNTGWIVGFMPITIALAARIFLKEHLLPRAWGGIALGAGGILLILLSSGLQVSSTKIGDLLQLSSCVTWTAYTLLAVPAITRNSARDVTRWTISVAAVATLAAGVTSPTTAGPSSAGAILSILFLGTICSGVAYWLWYGAVRDVGSTTTGSYLYLEPFVTWLAAWLTLGEHISWLGVCGGVTVLGGVWLVSSARRTAGCSTLEPRSSQTAKRR